MRLYEKKEIILSEDTTTDPNEVRFKSESEDIDLTNLLKNVGRSDTYAIGVHSIGMGKLTTAWWLYLKADQDITVKFNGSATPFNLVQNKPFSGWTKFTSMEITTTAETRINLEIAGQ